MTLTGRKIAKELDAGRIVIDPFDPKRLGPCSYDLTLGPTLAVYRAGILDAKLDNEVLRMGIPSGGIVLKPGRLYLGVTAERFGSDEYVPRIGGVSSVGRLGISVHQTAGEGEPGYKNHWTLEISVVERVRIYAGMRIAQAYFSSLEGSVTPYAGRYAEPNPLPVPSRSWKDFLPKDG